MWSGERYTISSWLEHSVYNTKVAVSITVWAVCLRVGSLWVASNSECSVTL